MRWLAGLIDPIGRLALDDVTRYWTVAERGTRLDPVHRHCLLLESSGVRRDRCGAAGAHNRALSPPAARGPRLRAPSKPRSRPAAAVRTRRVPVASSGGAGIWAQFVSCARLEIARHPAQLDIPGLACAGGRRRAWSSLMNLGESLRHAAAADDASSSSRRWRHACVFVAADPGGPVQRRDRVARAGGQHRRDHRRDTGAELCLSGCQARGGRADAVRHSWRGNGRRASPISSPKASPASISHFYLVNLFVLRRPADGDVRRAGDLRPGAGEPEISSASWSS